MHDLRWTLAAQPKSYTKEIPLKHHQLGLQFKRCHCRHMYSNVFTGTFEFQINSSEPNIQLSAHK